MFPRIGYVLCDSFTSSVHLFLCFKASIFFLFPHRLLLFSSFMKDHDVIVMNTIFTIGMCLYIHLHLILSLGSHCKFLLKSSLSIVVFVFFCCSKKLTSSLHTKGLERALMPKCAIGRTTEILTSCSMLFDTKKLIR